MSRLLWLIASVYMVYEWHLTPYINTVISIIIVNSLLILNQKMFVVTYKLAYNSQTLLTECFLKSTLGLTGRKCVGSHCSASLLSGNPLEMTTQT